MRFLFSDDTTADERAAHSGRRAVVWIGSQPRRTILIPYDEEGIVTDDADLSAGGLSIVIAKGSRVSEEDDAIVVAAANGTRYTIDSTGLVSFETTRAAAEVDLSIRYFHYKDGKEGSAFDGVRFRILAPAAIDGTLRAETLRVTVRLDPNHLTDPSRTSLTTDVPNAFTSTLLTPAGAAITLTPDGGKIVSAMAFDPVLGVMYETPNSTFTIVDDKSSEVLLGLSGAERGAVPRNAGVVFVAGGPAFGPSFLRPQTTNSAFPLIANVAGSPHPVTTAWVYFDTRGLTGMPPPGYYSAPASSSLFSATAPPVLAPFDPVRLAAFDRKKGVDGAPAASFPLVPYAGFFGGDAAARARLQRFENELLAPARSRAVYDLGQQQGPQDFGPQGFGLPEGSVAAGLRGAITPQGVISEFTADGAWKVKNIARTFAGKFPLEIRDIDDSLRAALLSNQLFLVISSKEKFAARAKTNFMLTADIAARLVQKGRVTPGSVRRVMPLFGQLFTTRDAIQSELGKVLSDGKEIIAYRDESEFAQLTVSGFTFQLAPAAWTGDTILIIKSSSQSVPAIVENLAAWTLPGLLNDDPAAAQTRLRDFIAAARRDVATHPDLRYFVDTVAGDGVNEPPAWNGILYLNVSVPAVALPPAIRGLAAGFDPSANLPAHHFGINSSTFRFVGSEIVPSNSAVFGLVAFSGEGSSSTDPYDFRVLSLRAEVVNSVLVSFSSEIELTINQLFGEPAKLDSGGKSAILLDGQLQQHGDGDSFTFVYRGDDRFDVQSSIVSSMTITDAQFVTLPGATGPGEEQIIRSQFILAGELAFKPVTGFDPLSFGGGPSSLTFENLLIGIDRPSSGARTFFFNAGQVVFDRSASNARPGSLYEQFPLALNGMRQGATNEGRTVTPASLGFVPVTSPDGSKPGGPNPPPIWFGVLSDLSLGSAGALAPLANFTAQLLVAWAPGGRTPAVWIQFPERGGSSIAIEGAILMTFNEIAFAYDEGGGDTLLVFGEPEIGLLGVSFFGLKSKLTVVLFGNPDPDGTRTLGWYATARNSSRAVSGRGAESVHFFGMSQNLDRRDNKQVTAQSIPAVLDQLSNEFFVITSSGTHPLASLPALKFSSRGNWIIALQITLGAIELAVVFVDTRLYGGHLALNHDIFKKLKGLSVDFLYNKISDDLGLYHFILQIPESIRKFDVGALTITLPAIGVDIFTNGDFRVDVGFPDGLDFGRSFAITAGITSGRGGFLFGRYTAASSPIQQPTNGTFEPLTRFGVALELAYEIEYPRKDKTRSSDKAGGGILSGKAGVSLIGIVDGVIAPFNPANNAVAPATYYKIKGTIALVGSIEGTLDLKIISIKLSAQGITQVSLTLEAFEPVLVELNITVEVAAVITIIFIPITLSFVASFDLSFTIGSRSKSPWILPGTSDSLVTPFTLRSQRPNNFRRRLTPVEIQGLADAGGMQPPAFDPIPLYGKIVQVPISLMPALTVGVAAGKSTLQVVMLLIAGNSTRGAAQSSREVLAGLADNAADAPFNTLASSMLLWSIAAQTRRDPNAAPVRALDLRAIADFLSDPVNRDTVFTYDRISRFLALNHRLTVQFPMTAMGAALDLMTGRELEAEEQLPGTIFPMIPALTMTPKGIPPRNFTNYNAVTAKYITAFQRYFSQFEERQRDASPRGFEGASAGDEKSFANLLFSDYFGLLAAETTRAAEEILAAYPYEPTGATAETLQTISAGFAKQQIEVRTREGDTLLSVAQALAIPVSELRQGNAWVGGDCAAGEPLPPDSEILAETGPTIAAIVENNPSYPLQIQRSIPVPSLPVQIRSGQTLRSIAADFVLPGPTFLFPNNGQNQTSETLLTPGATLSIRNQPPYTIKPEDSLLKIARQLRPGDPQGELNAIVIDNQGHPQILEPLAVLARPPFSYTIVKDDTFGRVAAKFDLTLDELAQAAATAPGILSKYDPKAGPLVVPNVASRDAKTLIKDLIESRRFNNLAALASRLLLNGLRAPAIADDGGADFSRLNPLYEMSGQQFAAPSPLPGPTYPVKFQADLSTPWLCLQRSGTIGPTFCVGEVEVPLVHKLFANPPETVLRPEIVHGPTGMPLYKELPLRYSLPQNASWQNATLVPLVGATADAGLTLLPFGDALRVSLGDRALNPGNPFQLIALSGDGKSTTVLQRHAWGTSIPIQLRRAVSIDGGFLQNGYEVAGAGLDTREILLQAAEFLARGNRGKLYLLRPSDSGSPNPNGLVSDVLDPKATFILKTNLTTVTQSGAAANAAPSFHAFVSDAAGFLQLVLQASVTNSGGFYLNYATEAGDGLPPSLFAGQSDTSIWILLLLDEQSRNDPDRRLYPFNNCSVLIGNPAPDTGALYVTDPKGPLQRRAVVDAGSSGFVLKRRNPSAATDPASVTRQLFSIAGYRLPGDPNLFDKSNEGLPVGPLDGKENLWLYQQTIPLARFGLVNDAPQSVALPGADANPYRGITAPNGKLGMATVALSFHDVYGNTTTVDPPLAPLPLPVGYTDELIPVSAWPSTSIAYRFDTGVTLSATLSLDANGLLPEAAGGAAAVAQQYAAIHYQVQQRDLRFTLTSNLGTPSIAPEELKAAMQAFVTKATVFATTAATLTPVTASTAQSTFGDFAAMLSQTPAAIAAANSTQLVSALFSGAVVEPRFVVAGADNTLKDLGDKAEPKLTPVQIAERNTKVPLTPGTVIGVNEKSVVVKDVPPSQSTLAAIAAASNSTVFSVFEPPQGEGQFLGFYPKNSGEKGLIAPQEIRLRGRSATADATTSLHDLYLKFADLYNNNEQRFANDVATIQNLFRNPVTLKFNTFVVPQAPFTFSDFKPADGSLPAIAAFNFRVKNIFVATSPIAAGGSSRTPPPAETIDDFARRAAITAEQFGAANAATPLKPNQTVTVPGVFALPASQPLYSAYSPRIQDSLQTIIGSFGDTSAVINRNLPGIFNGTSFALFGLPPITPAPLDSLNDVFNKIQKQRQQTTYEQFIGALMPIAGIYRTNGVFVTLAPLSRGLSLNDLATRVNVAPLALLTTNASLRGFLRNGSSIRARSGQSLTIGSYETINSVIARFAAMGVQVTVADLADVNGSSPSLLTDQLALVPPNATRIDSGFEALVPPPTMVAEEKIIFPVDVGIRLDRSPQLVHPQFTSARAVASVTSDVAPLPTLTPSGYVLDDFAEAFERAFATYRLKCAVTRGTGNAENRGSDVYAVNFGTDGLSSLKVGPAQPQFYSLAPLSTSLIAGVAKFKPYVSGSGLSDKAIAKNFDSADLDNWMQQLLTTIDVTLTPSYAIPGFFAAASQESPRFASTPAASIGPVGFGARSEVPADFVPAREAVAGPKEIDALIAAKSELASGLRGRIEPILAAGATGTPGFEAARDALYQQLLVRLGDAYTVDAVVQFPVDVTSSFPTGATIPPRFAGKVEPVQYRITSEGGNPPATSISAVAGFYRISPAYLADALGDVQGLLRAGATVRIRTIGETDTIRSVAQALGVPRNAAWPQWVDFIEGPNGIGRADVFYRSATFPLTQVSRPVDARDSLDTFAQFIDRPVINVGRGSQNLPGIFREGARFKITGFREYIVRQNDTLANIARSLAPESAPAPSIDVDKLSLSLAGVTGLFPDKQQLHTAIVLPDVSFTTSKISLAKGGTVATRIPELTFLLNTRQPARQKNLFLNLRYDINQIEYGIRKTAGGYESSSWLSFVLPIGSGRGFVPPQVDTALPQTQVPIPLRAYPSPPLLIAQHGAASNPQSTELDKAKLWTYDFTAETNLAAQDTGHLEVVFTQGALPDGAFAAGEPPVQKLFSALAGFIDAAPQLRNDLALLTKAGGSNNRTAAFALQALTAYAALTGDALRARVAASASTPTPEVFRYAISTDDDRGQLTFLTLTIEKAPQGLPAFYPDIFVQDANGERKLEPQTKPGVYKYVPPIPANVPVTHRFRFANLDVIARKNAYGGMSITRNDNLIASGPIGVTGSTGPMPTNERFIYTTDEVRFVDGLTPIIDNRAVIAVSLSGSLKEKLVTLLTQVLALQPGSKIEPSLITLKVSFAFPAGEALRASTPIRLVPQRRVGTTTVQGYASDLAKSIEEWLAAQRNPSRSNTLVLDLTVLSATPLRGPTGTFEPIGPTGVEPLRPVLRLRELQFPGPTGFGKEPA